MAASSFKRLRWAFGGPSWKIYLVVITLEHVSHAATAAPTDSPVHYITWSGFPVLSFREADNFVTEKPTQYSPKLFHFPVPFTFNGKPALVIHMNKPSEKPKSKLSGLPDASSSVVSPSFTPNPATTSAFSTAILASSSTAEINENSTSTPKFGLNSESTTTFTGKPSTHKSFADQTRVSPGVLKLHNTFVGNGQPHSFFVLKTPGGRIYDFNRKSHRRRNKPKTTMRRIVLKS